MAYIYFVLRWIQYALYTQYIFFFFFFDLYKGKRWIFDMTGKRGKELILRIGLIAWEEQSKRRVRLLVSNAWTFERLFEYFISTLWIIPISLNDYDYFISICLTRVWSPINSLVSFKHRVDPSNASFFCVYRTMETLPCLQEVEMNNLSGEIPHTSYSRLCIALEYSFSRNQSILANHRNNFNEAMEGNPEFVEK